MVNFYAVKVGRNPGIFSTWDECQKSVNGYPGAKFQKFQNRSEAEKFIGNDVEPTVDIKKTQVESQSWECKNIPYAVCDKKRLVVYVDGGARGNPGVCGTGVHFTSEKISGNNVFEDKLYPTSREYNDVAYYHGEEGTNNLAEIYGVYLALKIAEDDIHLVTDSKYVFNTITSWLEGWIANKQTDKKHFNLWKKIFKRIKGKNISIQWCKAHCGIEGNEEADRLANLAMDKKKTIVMDD